MDEHLINKYREIEITISKIRDEVNNNYNQAKIYNVDENKLLNIYNKLNESINNSLKTFVIENMIAVKETVEDKINNLQQN